MKTRWLQGLVVLLTMTCLPLLAQGYGRYDHFDEHEDRATDPGRIIVGNTAIPRETGTWNWTTHGLGIHKFDKQVSRNLNAGITTLLPVGIFGAMGHLTMYSELGDGVHFGFKVQAGAAYSVLFDNMTMLLYGGGPILTFGNRRVHFNIQVPVYGITLMKHSSSSDSISPSPEPPGGGNPAPRPEPTRSSFRAESEMFILPNIGFSAQINRVLRFHIEVHVPFSPGFNVNPNGVINGHLWLVSYGLRLTGRNMYGDIFFVIPIFEDAGEILRYMPLGIPGFSLGYRF